MVKDLNILSDRLSTPADRYNPIPNSHNNAIEVVLVSLEPANCTFASCATETAQNVLHHWPSIPLPPKILSNQLSTFSKNRIPAHLQCSISHDITQDLLCDIANF